MDSFTEALHSLGRGLWVQHFETYESIVWEDESQTVSKEAIEQKQKELQTAYDAQEYARNRKAEYPPWADQLDHIFHNGVASWKTNVVQPVKDKYPKPE
jgi:hypothetical protein